MNEQENKTMREKFQEWHSETRNLEAGVGFPPSTDQISDWWELALKKQREEYIEALQWSSIHQYYSFKQICQSKK